MCCVVYYSAIYLFISDTPIYVVFDESEQKLRGAKKEYAFARYGLPHDADAVDTVD